MDSVTNEDQSLQIRFQVYTYFDCWVTITARSAWQEEGKVWLKNSADFLPVSLNWKTEHHVSFFFLSRNLFPGGSLKNGTWDPCVQTNFSVRKHPVNIALAILGKPDGFRIFLQ